ncbi:MAG: hypothetical protein JSS63_12525 [Bacteroidetes bacterium]|nr:hypothetical protein [Bacteroidota bacterium]
MTNKQNIFNVIEKEIGVLKALHSKITPEMLSFSPYEGMRTTEEILQYLTWVSSATLSFFLLEDKSKADDVFTNAYENSKSATYENFKQRMGAELIKMKELFEQFTEEDLLTREVLLPWQQPMILGQALMETIIKWLSGYKMQLFIYMKQNGIKLDTGDCWIYTEK